MDEIQIVSEVSQKDCGKMLLLWNITQEEFAVTGALLQQYW